MEYLNKGSNLTNTNTNIITAGTSNKLLIKTIHATNVSTSSTNIYISWNDDSESQSYSLAYNINLPEASSFQALDGTFVLDNNDSISAYSDNNNSVDLTISYVEISNTEG